MLAFTALVHYIILEPWGCGCNYLSAEIQKAVIFAMGAFGLFMVAKALLLFLIGRPKFDWHMIYGNFLLNVITIVMLVPFIISAAAQMCNIENIKEGGAESPASLVWSVFSHFVDPGNIGNAAADHTGWATLIALLGVFLMNGLLIATLTGWIDSHKEKWLKGEVTYFRPSMQRHYIIIGGNDMVAGIERSSAGVIFVVLKDFSQRHTTAAELASELNGELYTAIPEAECYAIIPPSIPGLGITSDLSLQVQDLEGRGTAYLYEHTLALMKRHAEVMLPKFRCVLEYLEQEIAPAGIAQWQKPKGGYFVSVNTLPGLANAAASAIDSMNLSVVVGTLAGDDTVLVVMRDTNAAAQFCGEISNLAK